MTSEPEPCLQCFENPALKQSDDNIQDNDFVCFVHFAMSLVFFLFSRCQMHTFKINVDATGWALRSSLLDCGGNGQTLYRAI